MVDSSLRTGRRQSDPKGRTADRRSPDTDPVEAEPTPAADPAQAGAFEAQLLGQEGQKRGLRGGKPLRDHARSAYLETEFAGPNDRRPPKGMLTKKKI